MVCVVCLSTRIVCVVLRWALCSLFLPAVLPVALSGARDGSVQSDASSSPSEQSQLGQSHPGYPMGPQVSEGIMQQTEAKLRTLYLLMNDYVNT